MSVSSHKKGIRRNKKMMRNFLTYWGLFAFFEYDLPKIFNQNLKIMKNIVLVFGLLFLLFSCGIEKQKPPLEQIRKEKKYITFDKNELVKADTIEILYVISGTVIFASVKTTLIKDTVNNQYFVSIYYSRGKTLVSKKVPFNVVNDVFEIQEQVIKYQSEEDIYCLEFEELSILINKKVLYSRKNGHKKDKQWSKYSDFWEEYLHQ